MVNRLFDSLTNKKTETVENTPIKIIEQNRNRAICLIIILFLFLLTGVKVWYFITNNYSVEINDIRKTLYGYKVVGDEPYLKLQFPDKRNLNKYKLKFVGFNTASVDVKISTADYDKRISSYNEGEVAEYNLEGFEKEGDYIYIYLSPLLSIGKEFKDVELKTNEQDLVNISITFGIIVSLIILFSFLKIHLPCFLRKKSLLFFILSLTTIVFFLYFRYIEGKYYLLYIDIGADSFYQFYPNHIDTARRLGLYGWSSGWNTRVGLGTPAASYFPTLTNWFVLFGEKNIPYLLTVNQCVKIILAGLFCYLYCGELTEQIWLKWILALGYAFSADLIIRGAWEAYGARAVLCMLWLFLYEKGRKKNRISYKLIGTAIFFINVGDTYYVIIYSFIFIAYSFLRYVSEKKHSPRSKSILFKYVAFVLLALVIASLQGRTILNGIKSAISSERFSGKEISLLSTSEELSTGFLRTINSNIVGISANYTGSWDYLEDLSLYCGILSFLLVPLGISKHKGKNLVVILISYIAVFAYILFQPVRYLANGFGTLSWKTSSFWIVVLNIYTVASGFSERRKTDKKDIIIISLTSLVVISLLCVCMKSNSTQSIIGFMISIILIIAYTAELIIIQFVGNQNAKIAIIGLVCFEVIVLSYNSINNRHVLEKIDIDNKRYYNDYTVEALNETKKDKHTAYFRIDKQYSSPGLLAGIGFCDSLAQGYMDSKSYVGGTGAGSSINKIVDSYYLPNDSMHRLIYGAGIDRYFDDIIGTKYIFSKSPNLEYYGYSGPKQIGNVYVYKNLYALPFAFCYNQIVNEKVFSTLKSWQRSQLLTNACVVNQKTSLEQFDCNQLYTPLNLKEINTYKESGSYLFESVETSVLVQVKTNNEGSPYKGVFGYRSKGEIYTFNVEIPSGKDEVRYEIPGSGIDAVFMAGETDKFVEELHCYEIDQSYYEKAAEGLRKREQKQLNILFQDDNNIVGNIDLDENQVLYVSIPFNHRWHIEVDGIEKDILNVNNGFIGCIIEEGNHSVKIYYDRGKWFKENLLKMFLFMLIIGSVVSLVFKRGSDDGRFNSSSCV